MKLIGRTLAVLAAAMVVVGFWLAVGSLSGSSGTMGGTLSFDFVSADVRRLTTSPTNAEWNQGHDTSVPT